ncbi:MAG: hypothetical protein QOC96_1627 [Acidobacteriota bacterium]|jgi:ATP-dependent 26S proteasome regulatory subunit|nr:hypothetical protein [Acidobacteriota bacterium]
MSDIEQKNWHEANQRYLIAALGRVLCAVQRYATGDDQDRKEVENEEQKYQRAWEERAAELPAPSALDHICTTFDLSAFERDLLLMCAGMELDAGFASLCATAQGDPQHAYPTFSLALAVLPEPDWDAISPRSTLRRWHLIEVGPGPALTHSPLRIDERILHYLTGINYLDERLVGIVEPVSESSELAPSHRALAERMAATWMEASDTEVVPIIQLCGDEIAGKRAIAAEAYNLFGLNLSVLAAHAIPTNPNELDTLIRLWERDAILSRSALFLDCDEVETTDDLREGAIARIIENVSGMLIVSSRQRRRQRQRPMLNFDVNKPTLTEQRAIWKTALGERAASLNGHVDMLVSQFNLNAPAIQAACAGAMGRLAEHEKKLEMDAEAAGTALWDTCRTQARPRLDDLAMRIKPAAGWEDLVLPEAQKSILRETVMHVRNRGIVYERWGFSAKGARGLGINAMFAGASGTGKTMAAEVLARELRLDLYRIDLSSVVSKYIGETEKNLRRVFDAAEEGGVILLFDEADALFGKRSEVKDSHDRHANIEVSYLLQRMEAYRGLAILTTNMKDALDSAFLRRLRFIVQFPFPDTAQREEIWRHIFPAETPTEGLDARKLAQLNIAGGSIRNIALNAAFLAADAREPVRMTHILRAARHEYLKLDKPLTDTETRGWV